MSDRFEESLGKFSYITIPQIKDYLSISSNTQDARLSNIVSYATGVIEHYIGQEILANDYVEIFDGGVSSVFTSRLPLNEVYQVTEYDGSDYRVLADPSVNGTPNKLTKNPTIFNPTTATQSFRAKRYGLSSYKFVSGDSITSSIVSDDLDILDSDFTIELYIRGDNTAISNTSLVKLSENSSNYIELQTVANYAVGFTQVVNGVPTQILGANTLIETQEYRKKRWTHVAVTRDTENDRVYLHMNGNTIANVSMATSDIITNSLQIINGFEGHIDELRVSTVARYLNNFVVPTFRFRPDADTALLVHFDEAQPVDYHGQPSEYSFSRDTGEITKLTSNQGIRRTFKTQDRSYPSMSLQAQPTFNPYPNSIEVQYRAGYEAGNVPYDLQLVTLDYIKLLYKQDQEKKAFSFEGENGQNHGLSGNFPPHIRRVLDLYRIL